MIPRSLADHAAPVAPVVSLTPRPGAAVGDDKLGFIDALRGLTAVSIVFFHTALLPQPTLDIGPSLKSYVYSLFTGVQCFYAISAFTLALSHQRKRHEFMHGTFFLLRRLFRIYPLYYVMLLWFLWTWPRPTAAELLAYLTLSFNLWPRLANGMVPGSWSLSVENLFYLMLPLLLRWARDLPRALALWMFTLALALTLEPILTSHCTTPAGLGTGYGYFALSTQMPFFAAGLTAFYLVGWLRAQALSAALQRGLAQVLLGFAVLLLVSASQGRLEAGLSALQWRGFAFCALLVSQSLSPTRVLVNRVTRFYGQISYSLYLLHPMAVWGLTRSFRWIYLHAPVRPTVAYLLCALLALAVTTPAAWLAYLLVEKPGMRIGAFVMARLRERRQPVAVPA